MTIIIIQVVFETISCSLYISVKCDHPEGPIPVPTQTTIMYLIYFVANCSSIYRAVIYLILSTRMGAIYHHRGQIDVEVGETIKLMSKHRSHVVSRLLVFPRPRLFPLAPSSLLITTISHFEKKWKHPVVVLWGSLFWTERKEC